MRRRWARAGVARWSRRRPRGPADRPPATGTHRMSDTLGRLFERIDRLEERERFADALVAARRACALAPGEPAAWEARGEMALRSGELAESAESWDRLTRLEPGSAGNWFGLGGARQR